MLRRRGRRYAINPSQPLIRGHVYDGAVGRRLRSPDARSDDAGLPRFLAVWGSLDRRAASMRVVRLCLLSLVLLTTTEPGLHAQTRGFVLSRRATSPASRRAPVRARHRTQARRERERLGALCRARNDAALSRWLDRHRRERPMARPRRRHDRARTKQARRNRAAWSGRRRPRGSTPSSPPISAISTSSRSPSSSGPPAFLSDSAAFRACALQACFLTSQQKKIR